MLSHASTLRHLSSRSHRTRPSSTPPLCSRQLVVALHLFAPPPPLDVPPPHDWLCCCRCQCAGVVAVNAQASSPSSQLRLSPSSHVVKLASLPSSLLSSTSVAIVVAVVARRAVTIAVNVVILVGNSCFQEFIFWTKKTFLPGFLRIPFFPCVFQRNFSQERGFGEVAGIPVFYRCHRKFLQEFLWDRNSCIYPGILRILEDSCSRQKLLALARN